MLPAYGVPAFAAGLSGFTFHFATAAPRAFEVDPWHFAPAYGGA